MINKTKIIIRIAMIAVAFLFVLTSCKSKAKVEEDFLEIVNKLDSYTLEGTLTSTFPTGTKDSKIVVQYLKPDNYYVEITNPETNRTQIIIKNDDGVYVVIPSINKSFQVKSSWPLNSSYPYLLQSLAKDIVGAENVTKTIENDKVVLELPIKLFDDSTAETEKIIFNQKSKMPEEVLVYDSNKNLLSRFVVTSLKKNADVKKDIFKVATTLETIRTSYTEPITFDRSISYPSYYPAETYLVKELIRSNGDETYGILTFGGVASYTIIEQYVNDVPVMTTAYCEGSLYVFGSTVVIIGEDNLVFYDNGVEYKIASTNVSVLEMIKMAESLTIISEK